jgi:hypothetical protein
MPGAPEAEVGCGPEERMSQEKFAYGDQVRHPTRPEWGVGSVTKVEAMTVDGKPAQRLSVRFAGQGVKVLNTGYVELQRGGTPATEDDPFTAALTDAPPAAGVIRALNDDDWLAEVNIRRIEEAMRQLPEAAGDPFASPRRRVEATLALYRFDRSGRGIVDWAVAQTGLDDPLSRFNRHELERFFDRWAAERDAHLSRLLHEAGLPPRELDELIAKAPPAAARAAGRRSHAGR